MWFGKYEDDEPEPKPKEDDFSMTANWVHFDEDDQPLNTDRSTPCR
jgi:hypothetical protein